MNQIDPWNVAINSKQPAGDINEIREPARRTAENQANISAVQRRSRSKFFQHSAKIANADGHHLSNLHATWTVCSGLARGVLDLKSCHSVAKPEVPAFRVIRQHYHAALGTLQHPPPCRQR